MSRQPCAGGYGHLPLGMLGIQLTPGHKGSTHGICIISSEADVANKSSHGRGRPQAVTGHGVASVTGQRAARLDTGKLQQAASMSKQLM